MEASVYEAEYCHEMNHWWYRERRRLFGRLLRTYVDSLATAVCADIGTSTGTNLTMFSDLGVRHCVGLEYDFGAIGLAREKHATPIVQGSAEMIPFTDGVFDLVTCTDVLEHVQKDYESVREIRRILKTGGFAIFTVPAFQSLWGHQDTVSHHLRRYRKSDLEKIVKNSGFDVIESFYFNWIMFMPVMTVRLVSRLIKMNLRSEGDINSAILNRIMEYVFRFDCWSSRYLRMPFGVSALIIARAI
jgi:SAM-dependent methyltransferase